MLKKLAFLSGAFISVSSCHVDEDCKLNGVCNLNTGRCDCDQPWSGDDCGYLTFDKVEPCWEWGCGFHGDEHNTATWGGSVIKDENNVYNMFAAQMGQNCTLGQWQTNSIVVHATSSTPTGPYTQQDTAVPAWSHNPQIIRTQDGTYVIYTLGDGVPGPHGPPVPCNNGKPSIDSHKNTGVNLNVNTDGPKDTANFTMHYSKSLDGPWQSHQTFILDWPAEQGWNLNNMNPAPIVLPNGTIRVLVNIETGPWQGQAFIQADNFMGPYNVLTGDITHGVPKNVEDGFTWVDNRGHWHALYHKMFDPNGTTPIPSPGWAGGHAFSRDGLNWSDVYRCFNTSVELTNGVSFDLKRRERPKLIFDEHNVPTHLTNGVMVENGEIFTLVAPLKFSCLN